RLPGSYIPALVRRRRRAARRRWSEMSCVPKLWPPDDLSALHHQPDMLNGRYVARRIAVDSDEIGEQAWPNFAAIGEVEDVCVARGRGDQHIGRGHSGSLHRLHLEPVLAVREDSDV